MQTRQLWLDLTPKGGAYRKETFVTGKSNLLARCALENWRQWPAGVLALTGPPGCGKSHLAHLWQLETKAQKLDLDHIPRSVSGSILIEDLPNGQNERALFRLINTAAKGKVNVLLTSALPPRGWPCKLPDLTSRLAAMHTITIDAPDDVVLSGILNKLFADRQIAVDQAVINYLLSRMERSSAAALDIVERIHARGHDLKQNIRLPLVRNVMREFEQENQPADLFDHAKANHQETLS